MTTIEEHPNPNVTYWREAGYLLEHRTRHTQSVTWNGSHNWCVWHEIGWPLQALNNWEPAW